MQKRALPALVLGAVAVVIPVLTLGTTRADEPTKVWKATTEDIMTACRLDQIQRAQEVFKKKNGVYAKTLEILADHGLISKLTASGIRDGFKIAMTSNEQTFTATAEPATEDKGFRTYMVEPNKKIRTAFGKPATNKDMKAKVYWAAIPANQDWNEGISDGGMGYSCDKISISEKETVYVASIGGDTGVWKIGPNWKPHGAEGSTEKSKWGDYRVVKGDNIQVGCLLVRIENQDGCYAFKKDDKNIAFAAPKAGRPQFRINDTDVANNEGTVAAFVMVLEAVEKDKD